MQSQIVAQVRALADWPNFERAEMEWDAHHNKAAEKFFDVSEMRAAAGRWVPAPAPVPGYPS